MSEQQLSKEAMAVHAAAVDICNRFATMYMDVHATAGPWGTKHLDDVIAIIDSALAPLREENERLKKALGDVATLSSDKIMALTALVGKIPHNHFTGPPLGKIVASDCLACERDRLLGAKA